MMTLIRSCALALAICPTALPAQALPPLHEDPTVRQGFYAIGLADEVRKNCPEISPRLFRAWSFLNALRDYARDAGYSEAQIDALQDNRAAKEALEREIRAELAARGAVPGDSAGYCEVGHAEIAKDSAAGRLLRVK